MIHQYIIRINQCTYLLLFLWLGTTDSSPIGHFPLDRSLTDPSPTDFSPTWAIPWQTLPQPDISSLEHFLNKTEHFLNHMLLILFCSFQLLFRFSKLKKIVTMLKHGKYGKERHYTWLISFSQRITLKIWSTMRGT